MIDSVQGPIMFSLNIVAKQCNDKKIHGLLCPNITQKYHERVQLDSGQL